MKILVIASHPKWNESNINKRLIEEIRKHKDITLHVLEEAYPDGNIDVVKEKELLLAYDRVVFQYPIQWYNLTPLLKVWQNEVLLYDFAYGPKGDKLHGKEWMLAISMGGPLESYQAGGYEGFALNEFTKHMEQTAYLCGVSFLPPYKIYGVHALKEGELDNHVENYYEFITKNDLDVRLSIEAKARKGIMV